MSVSQVEMEIIMPIEYTLKQVHDISLELQIKVRSKSADDIQALYILLTARYCIYDNAP